MNLPQGATLNTPQNNLPPGATLNAIPNQTPSEQIYSGLASNTKSNQATFPATPTDNPVVQGLKTVGNIPSSAYNFGKGVIDFLNPLNTIKSAQDLGTSLGDTTQPKVSALDVVKEIPSEAYKMIVPQFLQHIFSGDLGKAAQTLENDPVGQIAPLLLVARGVAEKSGNVAQFDNAMTKLSSPVTSPLNSAVKSVVSKTVAPFANSYDVVKAGEFQAQGITPPVSAITNSPFVKGAESVASKGVFGQPIIDTVNTAMNQIQSKTNDIVTKLTPEKIMSDENLGKTIQEGLSNYEQNFKQTQNKVYEQFTQDLSSPENKMGNPKAVIDQTIKIGREVVNQQTKSNFGGVDSRILNMVKNFQEVPDANRFDNLKATRTAVGEALSKDPENTGLKRIYGALSQDMNTTVKNVDPELGRQLDNIDRAYASGKSKIESNISQSIQQSNPERIAQNLIKRNSADTLAQVREMIGTQKYAEVSKTFTRQLFDKSTTRGEFDIAKLKNNIANYDQATIDQILTKKQQSTLNAGISQLEKLQKLKDNMKSGEKMAQGSQTAFLQGVKSTGGRVGALAVAIGTGNFAVAAGILAELGGEYAASKLFTTEAGKKFMTEGFNPIDIEANLQKNLKAIKGK